MTKQQAIETFKRLVALHGVEWSNRANIPARDWNAMYEANGVLSMKDRREALGLPT